MPIQFDKKFKSDQDRINAANEAMRVPAIFVGIKNDDEWKQNVELTRKKKDFFDKLQAD